MKLAEKRILYKTVPFHQKKGYQPTMACGNPVIMKEFLEGIKKVGTHKGMSVKDHIKFMSFSRYEGRYRHHDSLNIILRAFCNPKYNHIDSDLWMYANPLTAHGAYRNFKGVFKVSNGSQNRVLDLDNYKCSTIPELLAHFKDIGCPTPLYVSQTSQRGFHVVYSGTKETFSEELYQKLCYKVAGLTEIPWEERSLRAALKLGGVDPIYMNQPLVIHKFRVPGSINQQREWVVLGWSNPAYKETDIALMLTGEVIPPRASSDSAPMKKKLDAWMVYVPAITKLIWDHIPRGRRTKWSKFLSENVGFLKKGVCALPQERIAAEFGTSQRLISRDLAKLRSAGILKITKQYIKKQRATEYEIGVKFKELFIEKQIVSVDKLRKISEEKDLPILTLPYVPGETFSGMSDDIRRLYFRGVEKDDIVDFCYNKQTLSRHQSAWKQKKELRRRVDNWIQKFYSSDNPGYVRAKKYTGVDLDRILELVGNYDPENQRRQNNDNSGCQSI